MAVRKLEVLIVGDASSAKRAFDQTEKSSEGLGKKLGEFGKKATAFVTLPVAAAATAVFSMASDLNESMSKVNTVFGESAAQIQDWSKTTAESMGISRNEALEAAGTFGNLFSAMGIGTPVAADMSKKLIGLASDLASFNNANPADVLAALKSGLVGETEPLRAFGVNLNAARIEAEALRLGLVQGVQDAPKIQAAAVALEKSQLKAAEALKTHGAESLQYREEAAKVAKLEQALTEATAGKIPELDAAAKAQAAYSLIMADTSLAQGDFARTADGAANKQRILTAKFKDTAATLGQSLMPIGQQLLQWVGKLVDWFNQLSPGTQKIILVMVGLAAVLGPLIGVITAVSTAVAFLAANPIVLAIAAVALLAIVVVKNWDTIKAAFSAGVEAVKNFIGGAIDWLKSNWDLVLGILTGPIGLAVVAIRRHWDEIVSFIGGLPGRIASVASGMWDGIKNAFRSAINWIIRGWNSIEFKIPGFDPPGPGPKFGGFTLGLPDIPELQQGGITTGAVVAAMGDNRSGVEAIVPLERAAEFGFGGGPTVIVNQHFHGSVLAGARDVYAAAEAGARAGIRPGPSTKQAFAR
jgi:hypothetical protein